VITDLAAVLSYPPQFFALGGQPYGLPPFHYRKRKKLSAKALGRIVAEINIRRIHVSIMARSFKFNVGASIPEIDRDETMGRGRRPPSIEDCARMVREHWLIPRGPVDNLVDLIESNGGIVIPCDFGTDLIDAMSQRIDGVPVLFFVNSSSPADRVRHTLAHELAHLVLHRATLTDEDELESEADEFAGAFLLPAEDIRAQFRRFDLRHLANMKAHWKVSMASLAVRADRLGLISQYQSKMFWIEMGKLGYRKREPHELPSESPWLLRRMVEFHQRRLGYSSIDMAALLCLHEREFEDMYLGIGSEPEEPKRLRLVK
jgi:Zn-dependent peptidase ImmA (M78 family)